MVYIMLYRKGIACVIQTIFIVLCVCIHDSLSTMWMLKNQPISITDIRIHETKFEDFILQYPATCTDVIYIRINDGYHALFNDEYGRGVDVFFSGNDEKMLVQRIDVFDSRIEEFKPSQKIKWPEK